MKIKEILLKTKILNCIFLIFRIFPIKNNRIICFNFSGKGYGDSPKYIVEELLKSDKKYEIIWTIKKGIDKDAFNKDIKVIRIYGLKYFYYMATARIWISNNRFPFFVEKRKKQYYIQTWHSPLRLKKIEMDAADNLSKNYKKVMKKDSKNIDLMLSGCDFSYNIYKKSFLYNGEILKCGTPRCDMFFDKNYCNYKRKEICNKYNIDEKSKIILYAPTFRSFNDFNDIILDVNKLEKNLHTYDNVTILVRFHPVTKIRYDDNNPKIVNVTTYPDMQDLISVADILITDYSSCSFDMLIANKPCILYIPDLKEYLESERELYFNIEDLPFFKARTEQELQGILMDFDTEQYKKNVYEFCKRINLYEDGKASFKVKERIEKVINNEKI